MVSTLEILPGWALNFTTLVFLARLNFTLPGVLSAAVVGQLVGFAFNQLMVDRWIHFIEKYGGEYEDDMESDSTNTYNRL